MTKTVAELQRMLTDLDRAMPQILNTGHEFWRTFAAWAEPIYKAAGQSHYAFVHARLGAVLEIHGKDIVLEYTPDASGLGTVPDALLAH